MEKHYSFIKAGRVENTFVFSAKDDALAQRICDEQGCDSFIWLNAVAHPDKWATYDGKVFTPPTNEYLISIGVMQPPLTAAELAAAKAITEAATALKASAIAKLVAGTPLTAEEAALLV